jgi:uncharacterized protein YecT (DUF1311 family)
MESVIAFVLGLVADIARSVFLPQTTDWLKRRIPAARQKANFEENALRLEIMERLTKMGKDPSLIGAMGDEPDIFMRRLNTQQEVIAEYLVERVDTSASVTQAEMTGEAARQAEVANRMLSKAHQDLAQSNLTEVQHDALVKSQEAWEEYAQAQATLAASQWNGGSGYPMIFAGELERLRLARAGQLRELLDEWAGM